MNILYYFNGLYGTFFVDEKANIITYLHENDFCYSEEYLSPIIKFLGGKIIKINLWGEYTDDDILDGKYKDEILNEIKHEDTSLDEPKIANREARYKAVMKYHDRIVETGRSHKNED